ncbi:hypothetical protein [Adhaeribacter terreus]|uniref:Uncharacterized protein n=1 Tax=Adhaeribacter terreus TaxID=529703 RepID=A0ABW0E6T8_9BACT
MIGQNFDIDAQLVVSANDTNFVLVAQDHYIIVNFPDFKALENMKKLAPTGNGNSGNSNGNNIREKISSGGPLKKLQQVNDQVRELGLVVDVRVNNKSYIELGSSKSAKIKAAALFGIVGSFFSR